MNTIIQDLLLKPKKNRTFKTSLTTLSILDIMSDGIPRQQIEVKAIIEKQLREKTDRATIKRHLDTLVAAEYLVKSGDLYKLAGEKIARLSLSYINSEIR